MALSAQEPKIHRLRGKIFLPLNAEETDNGWKFDVCWIRDTGQNINMTPDEFTTKYPKSAKEAVRQLIDSDVGDIHDLVADLDKRLGMMERLLMRFINSVVNDGAEIPEDYKAFVQAYVTGVDSGELYGRNDIESIQEMFSTLAKRQTTIADILKKNYLKGE